MPSKRKKRATKVKVKEVVNESDRDNSGLWLERADHPLLNDVVLKNLFDYVNPYDLRACRLVCKKWTILSLPLARSTYRVTVSRDYRKDYHGVSDFVGLFGSDNCLGIPFTEFKLRPFNTMKGAGKQFIQLCGELAKKIDLWHLREIHSIGSVAQLLRFTPNLDTLKIPFGLRKPAHRINPNLNAVKLFPESRKKPSLKYLKTLNFGTALVEKYMQACPTFFEELLCASENASMLLSSAVWSSREALALHLLNTVEKLRRESTIEILSLAYVKTDIMDVIQRILVKPEAANGGFKLKHLNVKYGFYPRGMIWFDLVELMKESLVSLHVYQNVFIPTNFPRMPNLNLLYLGMYTSRHVFTQVIKIQDFSNSFPALQYLKLNSANRMLDERFIESDFSCPLMESFRAGLAIVALWRSPTAPLRNLTLRAWRQLRRPLRLPNATNVSRHRCPQVASPALESLNFGNSQVNLKAFVHTLDIFPNLKELELKITVDGADILKKIWTEMPQLEKLNIYGRLPALNGIESLITGISKNRFRRIEETKLSMLKDMTMEVRRQTITELIQKHRKLPSIGNLTNLRHLTLNMTAKTGRHKPFLSDLTGYFGIYTLKNLRHLIISDCKFTKTCSQILVSDMELDSWSIKRPGKLIIISSRWNYGNDRFDWNFPSSKFSFNSTI